MSVTSSHQEVQKKPFRDPSIYILKFLAVLFITNSHFGNFYTSFNQLATGGAIGDCLFFFCSGFTLFLGRGGRFDNWYKRRIARIYPTVFAWAIIMVLVFRSNSSFEWFLLHGGGWFVNCIMLYYIILYPIKIYLTKYLKTVFIVSCAVILVWYLFFFNYKDIIWMYKFTYFKWGFYFLFMLLGAIMGLEKKNGRLFKARAIPNFICLIISLVLYYGILYLGEKYVIVANFQIITLIPLFGIIYYTWMLANSGTVLKWFGKKAIETPVKFIGGLCLEVYICQDIILVEMPPYLNPIFPLNIPVAFAMIVALAYMTHIVSNWFSQTFRTQDYDWISIFKVD